VVSAFGAMVVGALAGGVAGYAGGVVDDVLMRAADFVMVLPAIYVALALRAVMPLVLPPATVFALLAVIFAVVGAPFIARGVRAIVRSERRLDYAVAAEALGASAPRVLLRHLLPAARGYVAVQLTLLVPAYIVAEATLSYVGLGFPDPIASWGTMLHDASANVRVFADFPWLLSPAAAMFLVVLGLNLALEGSREGLRYDGAR
jgi:peptide/nickel transport system permease protein